MAKIGLASAVGSQREPIGILGGLDEAINKTGDAIQADQLRKSEAEAKKKDQEQRLKDAYQASVVVDPLDKAFPEEKKEYEDFAKRGMAEIAIAASDPNITPSELKKRKDQFEYDLRDRKNVYGRAYDAFSGVAEKNDKGTHDTALFNNWFTGNEKTQAANMPNDDFMAASEADRAGKMVGENGMQATETKVTNQNVPYLNKSFEEKKKIDFASKADELVSLKRPDTLAASRGYYGKPFEFEAYTKRTDKISPTTGEYIFEFDEGQVDLDAKKFASSMVGEGNFGNKEHAQYQRALEAEALAAGNEAGFSGDRLAALVEEVVPQMAYDDFMLNARSAYDKRIKNDKDVTKAPSKGLENNINIGGGGENAQWKFGTPKQVTIREGKTNLVARDKEGGEISNTPNKKGNLVEYDYISMQTKTPASNPAMIVEGSGKGVHYQGVYKKNGGNDIAYFKFTENADGTGSEILVPKDKLKASTYADIKTNVGENDFEKAAAIGKYAPKKETTKGAEKTQPKDYGTRPDGTKKGKGYFGELKMEDGSGSVATEISMNFDDVLGGALIPSLVPTLTESEKKHLLKGNKATKEIQLKAIKHAEERASKGLSPFVDGGELKSKSGKPIYWDKTAKTYKYK